MENEYEVKLESREQIEFYVGLFQLFPTLIEAQRIFPPSLEVVH